MFSSNLGVDNSVLKSRVTVFSSVFSPKTNSILFRLLCKFTKLSARSVEQAFYWFKSSALLRSKDFDHFKNKARCRAKQRFCSRHLAFNKALKRTKTAVTFFAKKRKKAAINFGPLAKRYMKIREL